MNITWLEFYYIRIRYALALTIYTSHTYIWFTLLFSLHHRKYDNTTTILMCISYMDVKQCSTFLNSLSIYCVICAYTFKIDNNLSERIIKWKRTKSNEKCLWKFLQTAKASFKSKYFHMVLQSLIEWCDSNYTYTFHVILFKAYKTM